MTHQSIASSLKMLAPIRLTTSQTRNNILYLINNYICRWNETQTTKLILCPKGFWITNNDLLEKTNLSFKHWRNMRAKNIIQLPDTTFLYRLEINTNIFSNRCKNNPELFVGLLLALLTRQWIYTPWEKDVFHITVLLLRTHLQRWHGQRVCNTRLKERKWTLLEFKVI